MHTTLIVLPTPWDAPQLESCRARWADRHAYAFGGPDDETRPWDFDPMAFIESTARDAGGRIDGVASASDYPGATCAAAIAARLGLPGPDPEAVIRASHKYYSRLAQRATVPEATPGFTLVDPSDPGAALADIRFPCFIKPVKGAFSMMARRLDSEAEYREFLGRPAVREFVGNYMQAFNRLVAGLTRLDINGSFFLAEELLRGRQVTVDGYAFGDDVVILGVVDTVLHAGTGSFERFDYPSSLDAAVRERMAGVAERAVRGLGLNNALFNIEMAHDPETDRIGIIEINPRISGQFGDLHQQVDGVNMYEILLDLAAGVRPRAGGGAARGVAASFPLRVYEPVRVVRAPDAQDVRRVQEAFPGTLVWVECVTGDRLAEFERMEDGASCRYGIINTSAPDRGELRKRFEAIHAALGFAFEPA